MQPLGPLASGVLQYPLILILITAMDSVTSKTYKKICHMPVFNISFKAALATSFDLC